MATPRQLGLYSEIEACRAVTAPGATADDPVLQAAALRLQQRFTDLVSELSTPVLNVKYFWDRPALEKDTEDLAAAIAAKVGFNPLDVDTGAAGDLTGLSPSAGQALNDLGSGTIGGLASGTATDVERAIRDNLDQATRTITKWGRYLLVMLVALVALYVWARGTRS